MTDATVVSLLSERWRRMKVKMKRSKKMDDVDMECNNNQACIFFDLGGLRRRRRKRTRCEKFKVALRSRHAEVSSQHKRPPPHKSL